MRQETFRVESEGTATSERHHACVKGDLACARAAELLCLSVRQIKRLKKRMREAGGGGSGTRQPRAAQPPSPARRRAQQDRATGAHHLRRLQRPPPLRETGRARGLLPQPRNAAPSACASNGLGLARKRRAPAHRQRRLRSARARRTGATRRQPARLARRPRPATHRPGHAGRRHRQNPGRAVLSLRNRFRLSLLARHTACAATACHSRSTAITAAIFVRNDDFWTVEEQLAGKRQPTQFGRALEQLGITFIAARSPQAKGRVERLWGVLQDRLCSELRLAAARRHRLRQRRPAQVHRRLQPPFRPSAPRDGKPLGAPLPKVSTASAASCMNASSATTTSSSGKAVASRSPNRPAASASPVPKYRSTRLSMAASRSTTATLASSIPAYRRG